MQTRIFLVAGVLSCALAGRAAAFCGFYVSGANAGLYNNATQVVLMRDGARTVLSMQNNYQGPPENFAMVVPVPVVLQKDNVKTLPREIFTRVDELAAPRLVEYWEEDPCHPPVPPEEPMAMMEGAAGAKDGHGVKIEAQFTVGEYEIVILSAKDSGGLDTWLRESGYKIPNGAEPLLRPYVQAGTKFFVAKVDVSKVKFEKGQAMLSPLRFHYDSDGFSLPVRLGLLSSQGKQDLIVHILARRQRYEVANYPNVTIPTNLDVAESARDSFATFYAALFDATLERHPKAVVTEYAWDSNSCDPCPTPALQGPELATLGADVLPSLAKSPEAIEYGGDFVLTRLHARYSKDSLGEDLVFRAAAPIVGGREYPGPNGLDHGAKPDSSNNFQGRYIIRHPWKGPVACPNPLRNRWGGPPGDYRASASVKPATHTAFAPRGAKLATFLTADLPELGVSLKAAPAAPATKAPTPAPQKPESPGACSVGGAPAAPPPALVALAFLLLRRRRAS